MAYATPPTTTDTSQPWYVQVGQFALNLVGAGANPRSGGPDPCCPQGYDPPEPWPTNSGVQGAPPDYRTKGSPMTDPSPTGTGRKKDDFCDCIPISVGGRWYVVGSVDASGMVRTGLPPAGTERDNAVWVQVNPSTRAAIAVPGVGNVTGTTPDTGAGAGSGGGAVVGTGTTAGLGALVGVVVLGLVAKRFF